MIDKDKYSCTSNTAKLLKHLDRLKNLQNGFVTPIMLHVIPTHRCQLNCVHCCFKNRKDRNADMPLDIFIKAISRFFTLNTKAIEFTGGGDPTLWPYINEAMIICHSLDMKIGLITNGLALDKIKYKEWFDWVRVSLNTLDYRDTINLHDLAQTTRVSFCYIWNDNAPDNFNKVVEFSNSHKIVCRVAPDCIQPLDKIQLEINHIQNVLSRYKNNDYVFLSDFNIDLHRKNNNCRIHMIKPCLYLDGWIYACPSAELAMENNKQIQHKTRICYVDDIVNFYLEGGLTTFEFDCSYCKYVQQQELLEAVLMETEFNDFC